MEQWNVQQVLQFNLILTLCKEKYIVLRLVHVEKIGDTM